MIIDLVLKPSGSCGQFPAVIDAAHFLPVLSDYGAYSVAMLTEYCDQIGNIVFMLSIVVFKFTASNEK